MTYYKSSIWEVIPIEEAKTHPLVQAIEEYENGNPKPLRDKHFVSGDPFIKYGGWCFVLRPYLKRYWVKLKQYGINEYYALNKTDIRKLFKNYVIEIIEVKSKEN